MACSNECKLQWPWEVSSVFPGTFTLPSSEPRMAHREFCILLPLRNSRGLGCPRQKVRMLHMTGRTEVQWEEHSGWSHRVSVPVQALLLLTDDRGQGPLPNIWFSNIKATVRDKSLKTKPLYKCKVHCCYRLCLRPSDYSILILYP